MQFYARDFVGEIERMASILGPFAASNFVLTPAALSFPPRPLDLRREAALLVRRAGGAAHAQNNRQLE